MPVWAIFSVIFGACAVLYLVSPRIISRRYGDVIVGDAVFYYAYERSVILDHTLDFTKTYAGFDRAHKAGDDKTVGGTTTSIGRPYNQFPLGPALIGSPFFVIAHGLALLLRAAGIHAGTDGFGYLEESSFGIAGVCASGLAAWFSYRIARRFVGVGPALGAILVVWGGGSMLYYTLVSPTYSHAFDACAISLWLWYWITREPATPRQWACFGAIAGMMALMRWQEIAVVLLPLVGLAGEAVHARRLPRVVALNALVYCLCAVAVFTPQMGAWWVNFGRLIAVPQGSEFFDLKQPGVWQVLFSRRHGLLVWTPAVALGLAGLALLRGRAARWAVVGLAAFAFVWYINGTVQDWWGGEAFGARRFLSLVPFLTLGTAVFLDWLTRHHWQRWAVALVGVIVVANVLFMVQYVAFLHGFGQLATYPTAQQLLVDRFTIPFRYLLRLARHH